MILQNKSQTGLSEPITRQKYKTEDIKRNIISSTIKEDPSHS